MPVWSAPLDGPTGTPHILTLLEAGVKPTTETFNMLDGMRVQAEHSINHDISTNENWASDDKVRQQMAAKGAQDYGSPDAARHFSEEQLFALPAPTTPAHP